MKGILKVDPEELAILKEGMDKDSGLYDDEIEKMLKLIEKLRSVWIGEDATIFCDNFKDYVNRMKNLTANMRTISKGVNIMSKGYVEKDEEFGVELKKEIIEDESESENNKL